jgi:hypothetical protein
MREADLTDGRRGGKFGHAGDRWRPLAQQLAGRLSPADAGDEGMIRVAVGVLVDVERRLGSQGPECSSVVVPLVVRALRRHRREQFRRRPESTPRFPALQVSLAGAESELCTRLRRSPTVDEVANHLNVAEEEIIVALEAGWSAGSGVAAAG